MHSLLWELKIVSVVPRRVAVCMRGGRQVERETGKKKDKETLPSLEKLWCPGRAVAGARLEDLPGCNSS